MTQPPIFATLGCRLNAYETEAMKELSAAAGLDNAVVVNTCAVTAEAVRKARQEIRRLRRDNPVPPGSVLLTGTGLVPPDDFTLLPGMRVEIHVPGIGALVNPVARASDLPERSPR